MVQYFDEGDLACYNGYSFRKDKESGYYLSSKKIGARRKRLHVYVWECNNGEVPSGYHVHHIDGDKSNNEIDNLAIVVGVEHVSLHGRNITEKQKEQKRENLRKNALPKAKEWHASEAGRKWHSTHVKNSIEQRQLRTYNCTWCKNQFETYNIYGKDQNHFCSNNCKAAHRRASGIDNVTKICTVCGGTYVANKYQNTKRCEVCRNSKH